MYEGKIRYAICVKYIYKYYYKYYVWVKNGLKYSLVEWRDLKKWKSIEHRSDARRD